MSVRVTGSEYPGEGARDACNRACNHPQREPYMVPHSSASITDVPRESLVTLWAAREEVRAGTIRRLAGRPGKTGRRSQIQGSSGRKALSGTTRSVTAV